MGIGFRILLAKKSTIVKILTDYLYNEREDCSKKELKKALNSWSESHLENVYFATLRKYPLDQIESYLKVKFKTTLDDEFRESLGISYIKHFFK